MAPVDRKLTKKEEEVIDGAVGDLAMRHIVNSPDPLAEHQKFLDNIVKDSKKSPEKARRNNEMLWNMIRAMNADPSDMRRQARVSRRK